MIDTHAHLYDVHFQEDMPFHIKEIQDAGVTEVWLPNCDLESWTDLKKLSTAYPDFVLPMIGLHPTYVKENYLEELAALKAELAHAKVVAIGEIGLDLFIPELKSGSLRARQDYFYVEQLKLAREFDLPVLLHVRRSQDTLLKYLRRHRVRGGIAHAFNGSLQQAHQFVDMGFALGIGGAMTFERALQIRRLATELELSALVLETDAPDISPAWLEKGSRNEPQQVLQIARALAELRGCPVAEILKGTARAAQRVCPGLAIVAL